MDGFDFDLNPFDDDNDDAQEIAADMHTGELDAPPELPAFSPDESPQTILSTISDSPAEDGGALDALRAALGVVADAVSQPDVPDHDSALDLQQQLAENQENATMLSNISKMGHDTSMTIIKNMTT